MATSDSISIGRDELTNKIVKAKLIQAQAGSSSIKIRDEEPVKPVFFTESEINHLLYLLTT